MSGQRRRRPQRRIHWGHPLTVAIIGGLIALAGTIVAAVITSSGGSGGGGTSSKEAKVAIDGVTIAAVRGGGQLMTVRGEAHGLRKGAAIYAVAKPSAARTAAAQTAVAGGAASQRWFASDPSAPDASGRWTATIILGAGQQQPLTVQAVQVVEARAGGGTATAQAPNFRLPLEMSGPGFSLVEAKSAPVTFDPRGR